MSTQEHISDYEHAKPDAWEIDRATRLLANYERVRTYIRAMVIEAIKSGPPIDDAPARKRFHLNENTPISEAQEDWLLKHYADCVDEAFTEAFSENALTQAREALGIDQ